LTSESSLAEIPLRPFSDEGKSTDAIPYTLRDYLALVDWSGRAIRAGKRGFIDAELPPILKRLNIDSEAWELLMSRRGTMLGRAMGRLDTMRLHAATLGQSWVRGVRTAERLYSA
jgi:putative transposase